MSIVGFFIGLLLIAGGLAMARFNQAFANNLGTPSFVNKYFGPGRGNSFFLLLSVIVIFIGLFVMFGLFGIITNLITAPFKGLVK